MAFGFPYASHFQEVDLDADRQWIREAVVQTFETIGWKYERPHHDKFVARIPLSWLSWGERLTVSFTVDGRVRVESRCAPMPQLVDWGKNQKNVEQFLELMTAKAERISKIRSLSSPPFDTGTSTPLERVLSGNNST